MILKSKSQKQNHGQFTKRDMTYMTWQYMKRCSTSLKIEMQIKIHSDKFHFSDWQKFKNIEYTP